MKFSWNMLNNFIDLKSINFKTLINKLTLAGFEVEEIEQDDKIKDQIITLNITANRKEINCIVNLAQEISTIFKLPLKIKPETVKFSNKYKYQNNNFLYKSKKIYYLKIDIIKNLKLQESPVWLKNNLNKLNINSQFLLHDIQEYINIKWGHEIIFIDLDALNKQKINFKLFDINQDKIKNLEKIQYEKKTLFSIKESAIIPRYLQCNYRTTNAIIFHAIYTHNHLINLEDTFNHANEDTIKLIATFGKGTIVRSKNFASTNIKDNNYITIPKKEIQQILGTIHKKKFTLLSKKQIYDTLYQLKLKPQYSQKNQIFKISVPTNRQHDLKKSIDIIEEIARVYSFANFFSSLPKYKNKGNISIELKYIKKIHYILINMGFNEVINSSLSKKVNEKDKNALEIYNPLTEEHKILRFNIIDQLIDNYINNIVQKNSQNQIFEIGTIFYKNQKTHKYMEEKHLGILINDVNFLQKNWFNKSTNLNWFHAKGIIETLLKKLQIQNIEWINGLTKQTLINLPKDFDDYNQIFIRNTNSKDIIGVLGQLNNKYFKNKYKNIKNVYLCEININKLQSNIYFNKHLKYRMKHYSLYPSVTRDISINFNDNINIKTVKSLILQESMNLVESIIIVNEYYNKKTHLRSICLRIKYQALNRTLNNEDLKNINNHIEKLLNKFSIKLKSKL